MRRAELLASAVTLALGGCMKIYPDPELPDIEVELYASDCIDYPGAIVALSLVGVDTPGSRTVDVACELDEYAQMTYTFVDVARERFRIDGAVLDGDKVIGDGSVDVDLRDGLDDTTYLYLGGGDARNFTVAWTFDMGASCDSLGANGVTVLLLEPGGIEAYGWSTSCTLGSYRGYSEEGMFSVRAIATDNDMPVAASTPSAELTITYDGLTDFGTLVMSPCDGECM